MAAVSSTSPASTKVSRHVEGTVCLVLAAGFSRVEEEICQAAGDSSSSSLVGLPKALLPVAGKPMLDHWWDYVGRNRAISEIFLVCNALKYKHFERWATARGIAVSRVVNTGATTAGRSRGVARDVELGLRRVQQTLGSLEGRDILLFAGDTLFFKDFDLDRILDFHEYKGGSLLLYYGRREADDPSGRGMCQVDAQTSQVMAFHEKPGRSEPGYNFPFVSPLFYILSSEVWSQLPAFNAAQLAASPEGAAQGRFSFGRFVEYAVKELKLPFYGMRMPGAFALIGAASGLEEYRQLDATFSRLSGGEGGLDPHRIHTRTYARVGLVGNPSDGFHGKTLALTIRNFWASVELWETEQLRLLPHPLYDPNSFSCLADLHFIGRREGYYGGTRLLMATCKRFQELCTSRGIALPRKNFTARYDTNIPRQVGLAGSSAIVNSLFQALMEFYGLTSEHIPLALQPSFILSVESELNIQAGLQDRVVQVYRGLVYMDFDAEFMKKSGHGRYERLSRSSFDWVASLPLFLAYEADPSDSGKIHSNVRARWDAGDVEVKEAMSHFAELTVAARAAIEGREHGTLCDLMDENFNTRRRVYGDACLGPKNLQMVEICRRCGAAAKFPGSGGAVLGLCRPAPGAEGGSGGQLDKVREALEAANFVFCPLDPVMPDGIA